MNSVDTYSIIYLHFLQTSHEAIRETKGVMKQRNKSVLPLQHNPNLHWNGKAGRLALYPAKILFACNFAWVKIIASHYSGAVCRSPAQIQAAWSYPWLPENGDRIWLQCWILPLPLLCSTVHSQDSTTCFSLP